MENENIKSQLEALLFAVGRPVSLKKLEEVLSVGKTELFNTLSEMESEYAADDSRGIALYRLDGEYQLATKKTHGETVRKLMDISRTPQLSQAAMEVLAIVAYNQPVTKAYIEQIRGVDCGQIMTGLSDKELVEEKGRLAAPGRPLLYGTTSTFLRSFGLRSITELPELPELEGNEKQQEFSLELKKD